jgi:hypothetical protein
MSTKREHIEATQKSFLRKLMDLFRMDSVRSEEIKEQLATESKLNKMEGRYQNYWRAHVALLKDFMLLKKGLIFNLHGVVRWAVLQ